MHFGFKRLHFFNLLVEDFRGKFAEAFNHGYDMTGVFMWYGGVYHSLHPFKSITLR